jgi:hypothetical protein
MDQRVDPNVPVAGPQHQAPFQIPMPPDQQQAPVFASSFAPNAVMQAITLDTKMESAIKPFTGADGDWAIWCMRIESHMDIMGWMTIVDKAAEHDKEITWSDYGSHAEALLISRQLWHILTNKCGGKVLSTVRGSSRQNGLESWRLLKDEFGGIKYADDGNTAGSRKVQMLRFITHPKVQWAADAEEKILWVDSLSVWMQVIGDYRFLAGEKHSTGEDILVATLMEESPEPFRDVIKRLTPQQRQTVAKIRKSLKDWFASDKKLAILHKADGSTAAPFTGSDTAMKADKIKGKKNGKGSGEKGKKGKDQQKGYTNSPWQPRGGFGKEKGKKGGWCGGGRDGGHLC